jgi:hypothetical protein
MKKIKLTQSKWVLVDDEDYPYLNRFTWQASFSGSSFRAVRTINIKGKHVNLFMEYFIMPLKKRCFFSHRNNNTLDNRKSNLISVFKGVAMHKENKRKTTNGGQTPTSKYKGVSWSKKYGLWDARINKDKKLYYRKYFKKEKDAALAYNRKAKELYGEFAYQNIIK